MDNVLRAARNHILVHMHTHEGWPAPNEVQSNGEHRALLQRAEQLAEGVLQAEADQRWADKHDPLVFMQRYGSISVSPSVDVHGDMYRAFVAGLPDRMKDGMPTTDRQASAAAALSATYGASPESIERRRRLFDGWVDRIYEQYDAEISNIPEDDDEAFMHAILGWAYDEFFEPRVRELLAANNRYVEINRGFARDLAPQTDRQGVGWVRRREALHYAFEDAPAEIRSLVVGMMETVSRILGSDTLPRPGDLYYPVKNPGEGTGWTYRVVGFGFADLVRLLRWLDGQDVNTGQTS